MSLFNAKTFRLNSGQTSHFKIDCDGLTSDDLECLAMLLAARVPPFGSVEGVPTGGLRLAQATLKYISSGGLLIVDDVLTTGGSMERHKGDRPAQGAVIFAREACPAWITPLFQMTLHK